MCCKEIKCHSYFCGIHFFSHTIPLRFPINKYNTGSRLSSLNSQSSDTNKITLSIYIPVYYKAIFKSNRDVVFRLCILSCWGCLALPENKPIGFCGSYGEFNYFFVLCLDQERFVKLQESIAKDTNLFS